MQRRPNSLALAALVCLGSSPAVHAQDDDAEFFRGKSIRLIVGSGAGDSFDLYGRLVARHLSAHVPGRPSVIVQNMQGAGSLNALNFLMNVAPRDGTTLALVIPVATIQPLLQPSVAKFDARAIDWIGSLASDYYTCGFWTPTKVSVSDLQSKETVVGSTAVAGATYAGDQIFSKALNLRFKIVPGYGTMAELNHAAEKGEVQGHCGLMAATLKANLWQQYKAGQVQIALKASLKDDPALPNVPNAFDLVSSEQDRQTLMLLAAPWYYGRPIAAPPGLPPERLATLRRAFEDMVRDPDFLGDAQSIGATVDPLSAEQIRTTIDGLYRVPEATLKLARPLFGITE